ncbi:MAG: ATP-dependent Clp protease adapter ClpS [Nitrospirae bacterium]|nr:MAG: ATP-dependent Clp protease adapter ClpS [Nitrospirota bacterium]
MSEFGIGTIRETSPEVERRTKEPSLYKVILLNDDYTTMDFVVHVLKTVFHKSEVEATRIMLHVHRNGEGVAGVYTRDIAETKAERVHQMARKESFPLRCRVERQ